MRDMCRHFEWGQNLTTKVGMYAYTQNGNNIEERFIRAVQVIVKM